MRAPGSNRADAGAASPTSLRDALRGGPPLVGTVVSSPDPVLAERLAHLLDFVWIDLEHSALGIRDAQLLAIAASSGDAYSLVRLPRHDSERLAAVLEMGVDGVVAPRIRTSADVRTFASALRYPPTGSRGFAPRRAQALAGPTAAGLAVDVACVVQIETTSALDDLDSIAAVEGVDALVVGANDLSLELGGGLGGQAAELDDAVARVATAARRHDLGWGLAGAADPESVRSAQGRGGSMFVISSDLGIYAEAVGSTARRVRELTRVGARS